MPKKFNNFVRGVVFGLSKAKYSYSQIINVLKEDNIAISKKGIHCILGDPKITKLYEVPAEKFTKKCHPKSVRKPELVKTIATLIDVENPPTQKTLAKRFKTSQTTIRKIISQDLQRKLKKKPKVHRMTSAHRANRTTNCRFLYENYLSADKWKKIVTIDEAWFYLSDTNKKRSVFYQSRTKSKADIWYRECNESFPKGFMVVAGISYEGKLKIRRIGKNAKINSEYYQTNILNPIFKEDIPNLYGNDTKNVVFHHDKATSHVSRSTVNFLHTLETETGITSIEPKRIPVKSPDCAPMDFCVFGVLKRKVGNRRPKNLNGLWKVLKEEWEKLDITMLRRSLLSWKVRCRSVAKGHGYPVEHLKDFNYGLY